MSRHVNQAIAKAGPFQPVAFAETREFIPRAIVRVCEQIRSRGQQSREEIAPYFSGALTQAAQHEER